MSLCLLNAVVFAESWPAIAEVLGNFHFRSAWIAGLNLPLTGVALVGLALRFTFSRRKNYLPSTGAAGAIFLRSAGSSRRNFSSLRARYDRYNRLILRWRRSSVLLT